ncbi:MAG TPA: lysozyme [Cyanobacteria bacterium UBA12227]|nr:lysozyme [Cyanobacteria bacterium UBA12227]HAX85675.1 lysozyme [Cyanobacteria bacterium UBA11370]HBY81815.1 lysozyme [Cyanobacteria bacterium UBA11148]
MVDNLNQLDLHLTRRDTGQLIPDRDVVDLCANQGDLATVQGSANLYQAILNRLCTRKGELASLGHPHYGSRLYLLVGELNNTRTRSLAELYIRESLEVEPRIEDIVAVSFEPPTRGYDRHTLKVTLKVKPVAEETLLTLQLSLNLT